LPAARYDTANRRRWFVTDALGQLSALPGVEHAALVNRLPLGDNVLVGVEFEGQPIANGQPPTVDRRVVSPRYFAAMSIPVRAGRDFSAEDGPQSTTPTAIVNESLVRRYWPDDRALGRRLRLMLRSGPGPWLQVVGVVGDVHHHGLDQPAQPEIYVPYAQAAVEGFALVVRSASPLALAPVLRETIQRLDAELPVRSVGVVSDSIDASVSEPRVRTLLFNTLASVGLALVVLGIYGVVSYGVARSTREIGLRLALGAQPGAVVGVIVRRSMLVVGAGAAVGLLVSLAVTRTMAGILFGVAPTDLLTFAGVTAVLFLVAFVAAWLPARAATRLDPVRALRVS
jgi:putative ABC transport system permease protein